jgi:hypothetical protein
MIARMGTSAAHNRENPVVIFATGPQNNVPCIQPLSNKPWGMREFGIRTVDGHRIMFGSPVPA